MHGVGVSLNGARRQAAAVVDTAVGVAFASIGKHRQLLWAMKHQYSGDQVGRQAQDFLARDPLLHCPGM